jgi:cell division protein FtsX
MVDQFSTLFSVVVVVIAVVAVFVIVSVVRNARKAKQHGLDPLTLQTDLAAKVMQSDLLGAERSKPERLAELDSLLATGSITAAEHGEARAAILRE